MWSLDETSKELQILAMKLVTYHGHQLQTLILSFKIGIKQDKKPANFFSFLFLLFSFLFKISVLSEHNVCFANIQFGFLNLNMMVRQSG